MVRPVSFLDTGAAAEAAIDFDDSIIEDSRDATIDKNIKLVNAGLRSKVTAIMEINKCEPEEAEEELQRIAEDNQIDTDNVNWTDLEGEDKPEQTDMEGREMEEEEKDRESRKMVKKSSKENKE